MRARLALTVSRQPCVLREVVLRDKPAAMLALSPKATVPVLQLTDGRVLDESLDIMLWALACDDPHQWLSPQASSVPEMMDLIAVIDGPFKHHLDRYKYGVRYDEGTDPAHHRDAGIQVLSTLNDRLAKHAHLCGNRASLADYAIFPFVRQFAHTDRGGFDALALANLQRWLAGHLNAAVFLSIMQKWPAWAPDDPDVPFPVEDL